jgi:hypothetical protein
VTVAPFGNIGHGPTTATSDDPSLLILLVIVFLIVVVLVQLAGAKLKRLSPGEKAPWDGRYVTTFRARAEARMEEGKTLPPPQASSSEGAKWRLKEAQSTSWWIVTAFLLSVLGLLYYSQNSSGLQAPVSSPSPPGPVNSTAPASHPGTSHYIAHHAANHSPYVRGHGRHGLPPVGK